jgi:hypothetical protein
MMYGCSLSIIKKIEESEYDKYKELREIIEWVQSEKKDLPIIEVFISENWQTKKMINYLIVLKQEKRLNEKEGMCYIWCYGYAHNAHIPAFSEFSEFGISEDRMFLYY